MEMETAIIILFVIFAIIMYKYVIRPAKDREDELVRRKGIVRREAAEKAMKKAIEDKEALIPNTCPHCKNPNTKKLRVCEWCGNRTY